MLSRSVCYSATPRAILGLFIDQCGSESNYGAIYGSNRMGFIFTFRLGFFFLKLVKREDI